MLHRLVPALVLLTTSSLAITPKERLAALESAAASGDVEARRRLVRALRAGDGVPVDEKRAYAIASEHAATDPDMRCQLALRLRDGSVADGLKPDTAASDSGVQKAAEDGSPLCRGVLIWRSLGPDATGIDAATVERYLTPEPTDGPLAVIAAGATVVGRRPGDGAAARGRLAALYQTALAAQDQYVLRLFGRLIELLDAAKVARDGLPSSREALEACAALDSATCMEALGRPLDDPRTTPWLERAVELGSLEAAGMLGYQRYYGLTGKRDKASGVALLASAAKQGDPASLVSYSRVLYFEQIDGMDAAAARAEARRLLLPLREWEAPSVWYVLWLIDVQSSDESTRKGAYALLERAAKAGDREAQADLGLERENAGPLGLADAAEANRLYALSSEQGLLRASVYLANNLLRGVGSPVDLPRAERLYRDAADAGSLEAQYRLGLSLTWGWLGRPAEIPDGRAWIAKAAEAGHPDAMSVLGELSFKGIGGPADTAGALKWFDAAARAGSIDGAFWLGVAYANGMGTAASPAKALEWLDVAARGGDSRARVRLGIRLLDGDGVPADPARGLALLEGAVKDGLVGAREGLARAHLDGTGVTKDVSRGVALAREAAASKSPDGLFLLGLLNGRGIGMPASDAEARRLYLEAADAGHLEAALLGGSMALYGQGGPVDLPRAIPLLEAAANDGYFLAQLRLGWCYIEGNGVAVDRPRGVSLVRLAAEGGYADAQTDLGILLSDGEPTAAQLAEAVDWYRKAAASGSNHGKASLGHALLTGLGVAQDVDAGVTLLREALRGGHGWAGLTLGRHFLGRTPPVVGEARDALIAAVDAGERDAIPELADLHMPGGLEPDPTRHRKYLELGAEAGHVGCTRELIVNFPDSPLGPQKLVALALRGDAESIELLGGLFMMDHPGLAPAAADILKLFRKRAEAGDAQAMFIVGGALIRRGDDATGQREGCQWAERSAKAGHEQGRCLVGICLASGLVGERQLGPGADALRQCLKSVPEVAAPMLLSLMKDAGLEPADAGERGRLLHAAVEAGSDEYAYELAVAKLYGDHEVQVDEDGGAKLVARLAEGGNAQAQALLGALYLDGTGVKRDPSEAARWLRKSSDQGHSFARGLLSRILLDGDGVTADPREAVRLAEEPAKAGNTTAALVLGLAALYGMERSRDVAEAEKWLLVAADAGLIRAFWALSDVYREGGDGVEPDDVKALSWLWAIASETDASEDATQLWARAVEVVPADVIDAAKSLGDDHKRRIRERAEKR